MGVRKIGYVNDVIVEQQVEPAPENNVIVDPIPQTIVTVEEIINTAPTEEPVG